MNVCLVGGNTLAVHGLEDRLSFEEDKLSEDGEKFGVVNFEGMALASETVQYLWDAEPKAQKKDGHFLIKVFDQEFGSQTAVGVSLVGSYSEGMGFPMPMGSGVRFVQSEKSSRWFDSKLVELLRNMEHKGFVTIEMSGENPQKVFLGCPSFMAYALMEGWRARFSEFVREPLNQPFMEKWFVSSLIHIFPYPVIEQTKEKALVQGLIRDVRKHFWAFSPTGCLKDSYKSSYTALGVATGWDSTVQDSALRVLRTSSSIQTPMIQYRKDLAEVVQRKWGGVERFL